MKKIWVFLVLAAAGGAGTWYFAASANGATSAPAQDKRGGKNGNGGPVSVSVVTATKRDVPVEVQANGTVSALSAVDIRPQTSNILKKVHIKEGQFVRAGDLLFTLDDRTDRTSLDKVQAQLARDKATLADLERQYRRSQELVLQKFFSQGASDTLQAQVEAQRALIQSDAAAVQTAQVALSYTVIRAPMSGRIGAINVFPGSLVQPGATLATVTQIDPIAVSFSLPGDSLQGLLDSQRIGSVAVKAIRSGSDKPLEGALSFIDSSVDAVAGTVRVKAQFDNRNTSLWPGQFVNAQVTVKTLKDVVVVPLAAIVTTPAGKFVYSLEDDQTVKSRSVVVVHDFGTNAVVSGLVGGEKVVVEGKQNLRSGTTVALQPVAPADKSSTKKTEVAVVGKDAA